MISNDFAGFSAAELTTFLRCDLFVCIDHILKYPIKIEEEQVLSSCMQLLLSAFDIIVKWMQNLPDIHNEIIKMDKNAIDSYMSNTLVAQYMASEEILLSFFSLCGLNLASTAFFLLNSNVNYFNKLFTIINNRGIIHTLLGVVTYADKKRYEIY